MIPLTSALQTCENSLSRKVSSKRIPAFLTFAMIACAGLGCEPERKISLFKNVDEPALRSDLVDRAHKGVLQSLKSPGTASFVGKDYCAYQEWSDGEKTYWVSGDVDAQNGFGALIRGNYSCTLFVDSKMVKDCMVNTPGVNPYYWAPSPNLDPSYFAKYGSGQSQRK